MRGPAVLYMLPGRQSFHSQIEPVHDMEPGEAAWQPREATCSACRLWRAATKACTRRLAAFSYSTTASASRATASAQVAAILATARSRSPTPVGMGCSLYGA